MHKCCRNCGISLNKNIIGISNREYQTTWYCKYCFYLGEINIPDVMINEEMQIGRKFKERQKLEKSF